MEMCWETAQLKWGKVIEVVAKCEPCALTPSLDGAEWAAGGNSSKYTDVRNQIV